MNTFSYPLWFAVRYVHVVSVALLAGGAMTLCALCLFSRPRGDADAAFLAASLYEWAFWSLVGVTVVTGVSNLGLKGDGLMGPATMWGPGGSGGHAASPLFAPSRPVDCGERREGARGGRVPRD